jgi:hypothetical protein
VLTPWLLGPMPWPKVPMLPPRLLSKAFFIGPSFCVKLGPM